MNKEDVNSTGLCGIHPVSWGKISNIVHPGKLGINKFATCTLVNILFGVVNIIKC